MPGPPPAEIVRLLFEAKAAGNLRSVCSLLDPDVDAVSSRGEHYHGLDAIRAFLTGHGRNVEVCAQKIEPEPDGSVLVRGRIRRHGPGTMADSPALWRMTVRQGRVATIVALPAAVAHAA